MLYDKLEAINKWCGSLYPPVYPIDLLFLSSKIQLRGIENLTARNTECTLFFMLTHLCPAAKWRQLGLLSFKDKLLITFQALLLTLYSFAI